MSRESDEAGRDLGRVAERLRDEAVVHLEDEGAGKILLAAEVAMVMHSGVRLWEDPETGALVGAEAVSGSGAPTEQGRKDYSCGAKC